MARGPRWTLKVDPIRCQAHGLCAELLPEVVDLDEWGYPLLPGEVPPLLLSEARAAAAGCPTLALRLVHTD
ncbi:MAG TPA: ferredoxin [Candidatus Nanopelagicales bacterium]|jgi:ferredoxin